MCYNVKRMCIKSSPFGEGRGGVLGLLEPADSVPGVAVAVVHGDDTIGEAQAVRVVAVLRGST